RCQLRPRRSAGASACAAVASDAADCPRRPGGPPVAWRVVPPTARVRPRPLRHGASRLVVRVLIALIVTGGVTAAFVDGSVAIIERKWETVPTVMIPDQVLATEPEARHDPVTF